MAEEVILQRKAEKAFFELLRANFPGLPKSDRDFDFGDVDVLTRLLQEAENALEQEILSNLLVIDADQRTSYLARMRFTLNSKYDQILESEAQCEEQETIILLEEYAKDQYNKFKVPKDVLKASLFCRKKALNQIADFIALQLQIEFESSRVDDSMPEVEFKSNVQKMAWLHELGVLQVILDKCKDGNTYNWSKAGYIIESFTGIHAKNIGIGCLRALYNPNETTSRNHPLKSPANRLFVEDMKKRFKLDKEDKISQ